MVSRVDADRVIREAISRLWARLERNPEDIVFVVRVNVKTMAIEVDSGEACKSVERTR